MRAFPLGPSPSSEPVAPVVHGHAAAALTNPNDLCAGPGRATLRWLGSRANRVVLVVALVALLSLADLYMTMVHLRGVGMSEGNPIARMVMSYNSPAILVGWKLATILVTSLIFLMARTRRTAEIGCYICLIALVWLTVRWSQYSQEIAKATPAVHVLAHLESETWVRFD